ncbi:MAG TPA: hypothetical protein VFI56_22165 [Vicinamibacterales bacterium]|nr:hypothetical protein [Vicinamibacterales bacterium]
MLPLTIATIFEAVPVEVAMCVAGIAIFLVGIPAATHTIAGARGADRIVALAGLSVAIPLAVFGALHLFGPQLVRDLVPRYMPWRMFWVYFVGCALIAASLSIASGIAVRWSGLLFGIMMFLFVAMIHLRGALARPHDRIIWTIVVRETSFGGAGLILAGTALDAWGATGKKVLVTAGRACVLLAAAVFGVEHFLYPTGLPGVPLVKQMPAWLPGRALIDYVTGAGLLVLAGSMLLGRNTKTVAAALGAWLLLLVIAMYGPILIAALLQTNAGIKVEAVNYFADTLLFTGVILALASAAEGTNRSNMPHLKSQTP